MKVNKTQATLYIFSVLIEKGSFIKEDILGIVDITDLQFKRYMQEIRAFIANFNKTYEVNYFRSTNEYVLKNE